MRISKLFTGIIFIVGILSIFISLFGSLFFHNTLGVITIGINHTSEPFNLKKGGLYSIAVTGEDWAYGFGGGTLDIISEDGLRSYSYNIPYAFDGEATVSTRILGQISIPISGNYYLQYYESQTNVFSGTIKITLQESLIQSIIGITDEVLLILGIFLIIFGFLFIGISNYLQRITKPTSTQNKVINKIHETPEIFKDDIIEDLDMQCPNCGNISDGMYCEECGTKLTEYR